MYVANEFDGYFNQSEMNPGTDNSSIIMEKKLPLGEKPNRVSNRNQVKLTGSTGRF